jgi:mitochondrial import receptor subunit TOM40
MDDFDSVQPEPARAGLLGRMFGWLRLPRLAKPLPNPGKLEDYNAECKSATQNAEAFDGIKVDLNKGLSNNFMVAHHLAIGGSDEGYELRANFASESALLAGRMDSSGTTMAQIQHQTTPNLLSRIQMQLSPSLVASMAIADLEYSGSDYFATARLGTGEAYGLSYMQSITERLALGLSCDFQGTMMGQPHYQSVTSMCGRYNTPSWVATCQFLSVGMITGSYTRRVKDNILLARELQMSPLNLHSQATVGCEYKGESGVYRASINSNGVINSFVEKRIVPEFGVQFCAELDNSSSKLKYGIGLVVGGQ